MTINFAKALLYAEAFGKLHGKRLPYLGHFVGTQSGSSGGYYCLECDPKAVRSNHNRLYVYHVPGCRYLCYRKALHEASKEADTSASTTTPQIVIEEGTK